MEGVLFLGIVLGIVYIFIKMTIEQQGGKDK